MVTLLSRQWERRVAKTRIGATFSVFLIALLMQVFAPAGAGLSMARALRADPTLRAPICGQSDVSRDKSRSPGAPLSADDCCQLCHLAQAGAAPLAPQAAQLVLRAPLARRIAWRLGANVAAAGDHYYHASARAPPFAL